MSKAKQKLAGSTISIDLGCNSCLKPKLSGIFTRKPKAETFHDNKSTTSSSSSSTATALSSRRRSDSETEKWTVEGFGRLGRQSVAVEKDSDDPYLDFRHSMLQMILENEIYAKDDLRELLNCFMHLNSSNHHAIIIRVFTEIWNGVFSVKSRKEVT